MAGGDQVHDKEQSAVPACYRALNERFARCDLEVGTQA